MELTIAQKQYIRSNKKRTREESLEGFPVDEIRPYNVSEFVKKSQFPIYIPK